MISYLSTLLNDNVASAIAYTLIHSLWQAALIALIMSAFLHLYREEDARVRYRISYCAMLFVLLGAMITFCIYYVSGSQTEAATLASGDAFPAGCLAPPSASDDTTLISSVISWIQAHPATIAAMWIMGICLFTLKLAGSLLYIRYMKKGYSHSLPSHVKLSLQKITKQLNLSSTIIVAESIKVTTPMLIGYLKPVILFPIGMINRLSMEETEAVLAHELAHVYRNDFLHNMILSVIEMIFYYHPAVWWISANVRSERENCCDDLAVKLTGNKVTYANALVKLEELKLSRIPSLAIPMARNKNMLLHRIQRIINQPQNKSQIRERLIATVLLFSFFVGFSKNDVPMQSESVTTSQIELNVVESHVDDCQPAASTATYLFPQVQSVAAAESSESPEGPFKVISLTDDKTNTRRLIIDTIPDQSQAKITINSQHQNQEIELSMENGEIKHLRIDGEEIPEEEYEKYLDQIDVDISHDPSSSDSRFFNFYMDQFDTHGIQEKLKESFRGFEFDPNHLKSNRDQFRFFFEDGSDYPQFDSMDIDISGIIESIPEMRFLEDMKLNSLDIDSLISQARKGSIYRFDGLDDFNFGPSFPNGQDFSMKHLGQLKPIDKISAELSEDGFLNGETMNKIELTGKHLKINGEKQASNIHQKYKRLYEDAVGHVLSDDSKIKFEVDKSQIKKSKKRSIRI